MATTAIAVIDNFIREELPRVIHESLPALAPIYNQIQSTSMDVARDKGLGRGWLVTHLYATGVAGLMEYANPAGPDFTSITGNQVGHMAIGTAQTNVAIFPSASESPHTSSIKRQLALHMMVGNFSIPVTWMQADTLTATQIKQVARDIKAVGDLRALIEASSFFAYTATDQNDDPVDVLGRVSTITEVSTTNYVDIVIDEQYGRISNFRVGMRIDVVADNSDSDGPETGTDTDGTDIRNASTDTNYVHLIITSVDYLSKTVRVVGINNATGAVEAYGSTHGWTSNQSNPPVADDWLVLSKCTQFSTSGTARPMMTWGLEDWIKGSGYIMGGSSGTAGLDLDTFHQFRSQVVAVNGPLTDSVMNGYIGGYLDAYPGQSLDTIITTQGVTLKYLEQPALYNNRMTYDRTGKALNVAGGWQDVSYSFNGRELRWIISPMCLTKRLYGCKLGGGNIKRYTPPKVGGMDSRIGGEVEFLAPLGGHSGIFKIAHASSGASQNYLEAPFWQYNLVAPIDPRGVKLTGLTEATMT